MTIAYRVEFIGEPPVGRLVLVSDACAALIGRAADVIVASPSLWMDAIHPDDRQDFVQTTSQLLIGGEAVTRHYRVRHERTGAYQMITDHLTATVDADGAIVGYEAVVTKAN